MIIYVNLGETPDGKPMRLRYRGVCRSCGQPVEAGQRAVYFRTAKMVECLPCSEGAPPAPDGHVVSLDGPSPRAAEPIETGVAGASARREFERRASRREQKIRAAHPKLGGLILALSDEPQSTRAWARGAVGEEKLAKRLDALSKDGVALLHDRRIRGSRANIDHIAISSAGVFVIDAKRYKGRPTLKVEGGVFRPRTEKLLVGGRDCTKLVDGALKQVTLVRAALAQAPGFTDIPVSGMLCFVEADWPLFGGAFSTRGVHVLWPATAADKITAGGLLTEEAVRSAHRHLADRFPPA